MEDVFEQVFAETASYACSTRSSGSAIADTAANGARGPLSRTGVRDLAEIQRIVLQPE